MKYGLRYRIFRIIDDSSRKEESRTAGATGTRAVTYPCEATDANADSHGRIKADGGDIDAEDADAYTNGKAADDNNVGGSGVNTNSDVCAEADMNESADIDVKLGNAYKRFMAIVIIVSILPLFFKDKIVTFVWVDRITIAAFIIDYLLRWITADFRAGRSGWTVFAKYPFTFLAVIDLLSLLSVLKSFAYSFKLFRLTRLFRALMALRLLRYSRNIDIIVRVAKRQRKQLMMVCCFAFGYTLLLAVIMFQVEPDNFENFLDALYWAGITLTTVGYGDIVPVSYIGKMVSLVSSLVGVGVVALPTGIITAGYMKEIGADSSGSNNDDR